MKRLALVAVAALTVSLVPSFAGAGVTTLTVNKCLAGKVKAAGTSAAARTNCYRKNTTKPDAGALAACLGKADDKFDGGAAPEKGKFEKLEAKYPPASTTPCLTFDDQATTNGDIATYASSVDADVGGTVGKCDAAKKKCVGKYVSSVLGCYSKAANKIGTIDTACTAKAAAKLADGVNGCLDKAAANGDCTHAGSQALTLRGSADGFIRSTTCALDPGNPGCACPTTFTFTANGADADLDFGWTGINHDGDVPSMSRLTVAISGCSALSGPIDNAGGPAFANHRCRGDTTGANGSWMPCTTNVDCPGTGNACVFFFGPPRPDHLGFGELCTLTEVGAVAGTIDPESGSVDISFLANLRIYVGLSIDDPCPRCVGGTCSGGARSGMACAVQGTSASFGGDDVSLDCPPVAPGIIAAQSIVTTLTTGTETQTLSAASPLCRGSGFTSDHCFCDTCNDAAGETCTSDGDCPFSGGNPGICGGTRCIGGANAGAPCAVASECPGGTCAVPGEKTKPNACNDRVCTPNTPPDDGSVNEGTCLAGPVDTFCAMQPYRGCVTAADCPLTGDSCQSRNRECFTDDGALGGTVTATGLANFGAPTLAGMFCGPPTGSGAVNIVRGLPGLVRLTIPGTATFE